MTDDLREDATGEPVANAEDETKTFDMYHVRSRWDIVLLALFVLALLLLLLYAMFSGGGEAV